ncbi:MAG: acetyl-CoA carboxylase, biotin carboxyl carrier protein [Flavobacteriales bacterium]|nr:acetyl-CoA carboxylase, biotin carboxyl carrier protein [Flavobacteriales bacterium]
MNLKQIQELIKFVAKSGATEVDLEIGDVKICIKSPPKGKITTEAIATQITQAPVTQAPVTQAPVAQVPVTQVPVSEKQTEQELPVNDNYLTIKSPIIGTFYRRPSPDKDPFINVGDKIDIGSVVGIVEAMKLFNEIESEVSGTIVKVLIDDMSPVEYDQPLFLVEPN